MLRILVRLKLIKFDSFVFARSVYGMVALGIVKHHALKTRGRVGMIVENSRGLTISCLMLNITFLTFYQHNTSS